MQINKFCIEKISEFLDESEYLEDLDLSWNNLLPQDLFPLFNALAKNLTLKSLNLSSNTLLDKADQISTIDFKSDSLLEDYA